MKVFVVEDDPKFRSMICELVTLALGEHSPEILQADNEVDGVKLAASHVFDLAVLDLSLQGSHAGGALVASELAKHSKPPVLIVSGMNGAESSFSIGNGIFDVIPKRRLLSPEGRNNFQFKVRNITTFQSCERLSTLKEKFEQIPGLDWDLESAYSPTFSGRAIEISVPQRIIFARLLRDLGNVTTMRTLRAIVSESQAKLVSENSIRKHVSRINRQVREVHQQLGRDNVMEISSESDGYKIALLASP